MAVNTFLSPVNYTKNLPPLKKFLGGRPPSDFLFVIDKKVYEKNPRFQNWLPSKSSLYCVDGGEQLKSIDNFPRHIKNIFDCLGPSAHRNLTIVAVGGGSVGDFTGFVASIFKRGVRLIQMPSTWLAAIDSAHGGKNALNAGVLKNQLGTFYPAAEVWIVKQLLSTQAAENTLDAFGELFKMALLTKKPWGQELQREETFTEQTLWKYLPLAVKEKYHIVHQDPYEQKGKRQALNLGHTIGHVLELHHGLSHGQAVARGLYFSIEFSRHKEFLPEGIYQKLRAAPFFKIIKDINTPPIPLRLFKKILLQDKKKGSASQTHLPFVFLKKPGQALLINCTINDLLTFGKKHGFTTKN